jgi:hypothetical protein
METHNADSGTQRKIEKIVVEKLEVEHGCSFSKTAPNSNFEFDFYNADKHIIGEIYAGIDNLSCGSKRKVIADCFKLVAAEKIFGGKWCKQIVFVDNNIQKKFEGESWINEAIQLFGIKLKTIEIGENDLENLRETKIRQQTANSKY